jgi:hypothetical protein
MASVVSPQIGRYAVLGPLLHRRPKGFVEGVFGQVEIAQQADQCGEDPARLGAVNGVYLLVYLFDRVVVHHNALLFQ